MTDNREETDVDNAAKLMFVPVFSLRDGKIGPISFLQIKIMCLYPGVRRTGTC